MSVNSNPPVLISSDMDEPHKDAFINQNFLNLANSLNPFLLSDGSNNRLLIGKDSAGNYVVKISKAGFDAFDATDANLAYNSSQNIFKIVTTSTITRSFTFSGTTVSGVITIAHGLSYIPVPLVFYNFSGSYEILPFLNVPFSGSAGSATGTIQNYVYATTDATNLTISIYNGNTVGSQSYSFRYYLLQETAN